MNTIENTTPLWLDLKIEYIDENFDAVKDYIKNLINEPSKDNFYYTTINLLNKRIAKLVQDEYEKCIVLDEDNQSCLNSIDLKLLALYLLTTKPNDVSYNAAFLLFVAKILILSPKVFNDTFIEQLMALDIQQIEISKILNWSDFDFFSGEVIAHKIMNYPLPKCDKKYSYVNKGICEKTNKGLAIYASQKASKSHDKVVNNPLFNDKFQLLTNKNNRIKQSDWFNSAAIEEFVEDFINEQKKDVKPLKRNYNEGDICKVRITSINSDINVETIDNNFYSISGHIDFSSLFWNYKKIDFISHLYVNDIIEVKYIGNDVFDLKETFENFIYQGFDTDIEVSAEIISIKKKLLTWGTEDGYTAYSKIEDVPDDIEEGKIAKIYINNIDYKNGKPTGFIHANFIEWEYDDFNYNDIKKEAIKQFICKYDTKISNETSNNQISKEEIKMLYRILISYQYNCIDSPIMRYKILCSSRIMSQLVEQNSDSNYIKFLLEYLKNLIFFAKENYSELQIPQYNEYDSPLIARRKCIIEILKMYGSSRTNINLSPILESEPTLYKLATLVESSNRLDNIITRPMQNIIKREIMKLLSISTEGDADLDEENGIYLGIEDNTKEFKTSFFYAPAAEQNQKLNIFKGICAFLNTIEGGTLYIGVNDLGYIKGIDEDLKYLDSKIYGYHGIDGFIRYITDEMKRYFNIDVIERVKITSLYDDSVIAFKIQPYEFDVVKLQNKTFLRVNSESIDISSDANAIKRIKQRKQLFTQKEDEYKRNLRILKNSITTAISSKKQAILHNYCSSNSGSNKDRHVEIFDFLQEHQSIWCYDIDNNEIRLFKISRIGYIEITEKDWMFESHHKKSNIDIFHMTGDKPIHISLRLNLRAKNLLTEEFPNSKDFLHEESENSWLLDTSVYNIIGVARFYIGLAEHIEIIEAPGLKDYVKNFIDKLNSVI